MSSFITFLLILYTFVHVSFASSSNSTECLHDVKSFAECLEVKHEEGKEVDNKKKETTKDRIHKCFKDNKCQVPDFNAELFDNVPSTFKEITGSILKAYKETPESVKKCVEKNFGKRALEKVNKCLKSKKLNPIKARSDDFFEALNGSGNTTVSKSGQSHTLAKGIFNLLTALKHCRKDNGEKAANDTLKCVNAAKDDAKKELCKRVESCKKEELSDTCRKREQDVTQAICGCLKDRMLEIKKRLVKLQVGKEVALSNFSKVFGDDFDEENKEKLNIMAQCFKDNKVDVPGPLILDSISVGFALFSSHDPRGVLELLNILFFRVVTDTAEPKLSKVHTEPKLSQEQISLMRDITEQMMKQQGCGCD